MLTRSLANDHHIISHLDKGKFTRKAPISNPKRNVKGFGAFPLRKEREKGKQRWDEVEGSKVEGSSPAMSGRKRVGHGECGHG